MVSAPLQKAVWQTYVPGQEVTKRPSREYLAAAKAAVRFVAEKEGIVASFDVSESTRVRRVIETAEPASLIAARKQLDTVLRMAHELDNLSNGFNAEVLVRALAEVCRIRQAEEARGEAPKPTLNLPPPDPFAL